MNLRLPRSIGKPGWAVIDQSLFALSNFALNLLLARWLSPTEYGIFTVGYTALLLMATFHTALLTEPMLVFGPGKYHTRLSHYLGVVSLAHWSGTSLFTVLCLGIGILLWYTGKQFEAQTVWALALTSPFILFLWFVRRACYARMAPQFAAYAGVVYLFLMVIHIALLYQVEWLSVSMAFAVLGTTSLITGVWLAIRLQIELPPLKREGLISDIGIDHWIYGRWSVMTGVLMWIPGQVIYFLLPIWVGLDQCAGLRALVNLIMPFVLVCTALGTVLTPSLVHARGSYNFQILIIKYLLFLVGGGLLYWLGISLFSTALIALMYNGLYLEYAHLLWILGLLPVFAGIVAIFGAVLRSLQQPEFVFWSYLSSTIVALTLGLGLAATWGIIGAVFSLTTSYAVSAVAMVTLYFKIPISSRKDHQSDIVWA